MENSGTAFCSHISLLSLENTLLDDVLRLNAIFYQNSRIQNGPRSRGQVTFASLCANHRVAHRKALAWLGHSSSEMLDLYYHLHD